MFCDTFVCLIDKQQQISQSDCQISSNCGKNIHLITVFSVLEMGTVPIGGCRDVRLERTEYDFAKAAVKPTQLVLRLVDKLFSKEVLMRSTVHGTKDFDALDQKTISAIKGKLSLHIKNAGLWQQNKSCLGF